MSAAVASRRAEWAAAREDIAPLHEAAGCCCHIIVEDGNTGDSAVQVCIDEAMRRKHPRCMRIATFFARLTRDERRAFLRRRR